MADSSSNPSSLDKSNKNSSSKEVFDSINFTNHSSVASSTLPVISPKLTRDNHRFWKSLILFAVGAHDLEEHLTGLISCPAPFVRVQLDNSNSEVTTKPNSAFTLWKKTDKLLMSWLLSSILEAMFSVISKCQTANDIWLTLEKEFLTESRAKTLHVRSLLQNTKKESMSMHDYFLKMKGYAEILSASGVVISDDELINYILDGLDSEYDAAVVNVTTRLESRVDPITVQEAQIVLQKFELRLEKANSAINSMVHAEFHSSSANIANLSPDVDAKKLQPGQFSKSSQFDW